MRRAKGTYDRRKAAQKSASIFPPHPDVSDILCGAVQDTVRSTSLRWTSDGFEVYRKASDAGIVRGGRVVLYEAKP